MSVRREDSGQDSQHPRPSGAFKKLFLAEDRGAGRYITILWPLLESVQFKKFIYNNSADCYTKYFYVKYFLRARLSTLFHLILTYKTIIRWVGCSGSRTPTHPFALPSHDPPLNEFIICFGARIYPNEQALRVYNNVLNLRVEELRKIVQRVLI